MSGRKIPQLRNPRHGLNRALDLKSSAREEGGMTLPTFEDVLEADRRIRPLALVTPLLRAVAIDLSTVGQIFV